MKLTNKNKLRIGDVAKQLEVKEFVIRFWEREFKIKAKRSAGGQRFYTKSHVAFLSTVKDLLYKQGYTISGAKKHLEECKTTMQQPQETFAKMLVTAAKLDTSVELDASSAEAANSSQSNTPSPTVAPALLQHLHNLKEQLLKLKEIL